MSEAWWVALGIGFFLGTCGGIVISELMREKTVTNPTELRGLFEQGEKEYLAERYGATDWSRN